MTKITITKLILDGTLEGLIVEDKYTSNIKDHRLAGKVYQGLTHKYKIISIEYNQVKGA